MFVVIAVRFAKGIGIEDIVSRRVVAIEQRERDIVYGEKPNACDIGEAPTLVLRRCDFAKEGEALSMIAIVESCRKLVLSLKIVGVIVIDFGNQGSVEECLFESESEFEVFVLPCNVRGYGMLPDCLFVV